MFNLFLFNVFCCWGAHVLGSRLVGSLRLRLSGRLFLLFLLLNWLHFLLLLSDCSSRLCVHLLLRHGLSLLLVAFSLHLGGLFLLLLLLLICFDLLLLLDFSFLWLTFFLVTCVWLLLLLLLLLLALLLVVRLGGLEFLI